MESRIKGQISVHVSLILFLIDDYTGKRISSSAVQIRVEGAEKPIYKKEGYYIFTNLQKKEVMVSIQAPEYQTVKRLIDLQELEGGEPLVKIRLQPGRCYSLLNEMTVLTGKTEPFRFCGRHLCRAVIFIACYMIIKKKRKIRFIFLI